MSREKLVIHDISDHQNGCSWCHGLHTIIKVWWWLFRTLVLPKNISKLRKKNLTRFDFKFLDLFQAFWVDELVSKCSNGVVKVFLIRNDLKIVFCFNKKNLIFNLFQSKNTLTSLLVPWFFFCHHSG